MPGSNSKEESRRRFECKLPFDFGHICYTRGSPCSIWWSPPVIRTAGARTQRRHRDSRHGINVEHGSDHARHTDFIDSYPYFDGALRSSDSHKRHSKTSTSSTRTNDSVRSDTSSNEIPYLIEDGCSSDDAVVITVPSKNANFLAREGSNIAADAMRIPPEVLPHPLAPEFVKTTDQWTSNIEEENAEAKQNLIGGGVFRAINKASEGFKRELLEQDSDAHVAPLKAAAIHDGDSKHTYGSELPPEIWHPSPAVGGHGELLDTLLTTNADVGGHGVCHVARRISDVTGRSSPPTVEADLVRQEHCDVASVVAAAMDAQIPVPWERSGLSDICTSEDKEPSEGQPDLSDDGDIEGKNSLYKRCSFGSKQGVSHLSAFGFKSWPTSLGKELADKLEERRKVADTSIFESMRSGPSSDTLED